MSLHNVGIVLHALLVDEELRTRSVLHRFETILELAPQGIVLTDDEIEMSVKADARLWWWTREVTGDRVH